jgi:hypothetical protein
MHANDVIEKSIERFGFVSPIIVDEKTNQLVAGHGRLDTLLQMKNTGKPPPQGVRATKGIWKVPVIRGISFKSKSEAEAYLLADNQTTIVGGWDAKLLQSMLSENLSNLDGLGFKPSDIQALEMPPPEAGIQTKREDVTLQAQWIQTEHVEAWLKSMVKEGRTLNVCCGMSTVGDVRLDTDPKSNRTEEGDLYDLRYEPGAFENAICDPPFQYYGTLRIHRGLKWLVRLSEIVKNRLLVSSPDVSLNNLLPRFDAKLYAFSDAKKPYFLRLYWCFDRKA